MANKPMKSIKLPGLADTYTFTQVDAALTTTGAAADAKAVGDALAEVDEALSTKAEQDGYYEELTAGQYIIRYAEIRRPPQTYELDRLILRTFYSWRTL